MNKNNLPSVLANLLYFYVCILYFIIEILRLAEATPRAM